MFGNKKLDIPGLGIQSLRETLRVSGFLKIAVLLALVAFHGIGWAAETGSGGESSPEISYPVKLFDNGKAQFFQQKAAEGITIRYFILKSSDGVIRAAFDACDVCWPAGKGYKQEGDVMVCRNCGQKFANTRINEVKGGCNPASLTRQFIQDRLVIKVADILEGKRYFDFSKRGGK